MTVRGVRDVRLVVAGEEVMGWTKWQVESDLLSPADAFSLSLPNPGARLAGKVYPGQAVKLVLDGTLVLTGAVDDVTVSTDRESALEVVGRDAFWPLVDCSATPASYRGVSLIALARQLTSPWSIQWQVVPGQSLDLGTHDVKVDPGDTPWDVLSRLAMKERVLVWAEPNGVGYIGRPDYRSAARHALRVSLNPLNATEASNVISSQVRRSWRERYSHVTVAGTGANTAASYGRSSHRRYTAIDAGVPSHRPLILPEGNLASIGLTKTRASDEVARRLFESGTASYTVRGHYGEPAQSSTAPALYQAGDRLDVSDEPAGLRAVVLCVKRRFVLDDEGPRTELELRPGRWLE